MKKFGHYSILRALFIIALIVCLAIAMVFYAKAHKSTHKYNSRYIPPNARLLSFGNGWYEFCQHGKRWIYHRGDNLLEITGECE